MSLCLQTQRAIRRSLIKETIAGEKRIAVTKKVPCLIWIRTLIPFDSDHAWGEHTITLGWRD
jgi:hypothetical protein